MSRVEKQESVTGKIDELKEDVIAQVKQGQQPRRRFFSCSCFFLICLFLFGGWVTWSLAATGFVSVPVVSALAYHHPEPSRLVSRGVPVEELAQSTIPAMLKDRVKEGGGALKNRDVSLSIPESSLTATLAHALKGSTFFEHATESQIAIHANGEFELFIPIVMGGKETALIAIVTAKANNGVVDLTLKKIFLGSFRLPKMLVASLLQPTVNHELSSLNQSLGSYVKMNELLYTEGAVTLKGLFTVELKEPL